MRMDLTNVDAEEPKNDGAVAQSSDMANLKDLPVGDLIGKFEVSIEIEENSAWEIAPNSRENKWQNLLSFLPIFFPI